MLRTTNNCPLSNQQRTKKANKSGADIHICIHCNASGASARGPLVCVPGSSRYVGKKIFNSSRRLGSCLLSSVAKAVNKKSHGTIRSDYYLSLIHIYYYFISSLLQLFFCRFCNCKISLIFWDMRTYTSSTRCQFCFSSGRTWR